MIESSMRFNKMNYSQSDKLTSNVDESLLKETFQKLMDFNQKKILLDTKNAMFDGVNDSLSKALNANIKQTDGISF